MAERQVKQSRKDQNGNITALCGGPWGPRPSRDVIQDIDSHSHQYFVHEPGTNRIDIHVVTEAGRKYLRTTADRTSKNNLDNLPNC